MSNKLSSIKGSLLGVGVGDALGSTLEFMKREEIAIKYGVHREMTGGGYWQLAPGEVTDDTDMTIAVAKGILVDQVNPIEHIAHFFVQWAKTSPKDIGNICRLVLTEAIKRGASREEEWLDIADFAHRQSGGRSGGNGSLMRTIPVVLAYLDDREKMLEIAIRQSALTHYDVTASQCVMLYCDLVRNVILGQNLKLAIKTALKESSLDIGFRIDLPLEKIKTSGYVIHTLEAALNCAYQTESLEDALIMAVNLGGDTDTIGAVTGGIVGAWYGIEGIPGRWLERLTVRDELEELAVQLAAL